MRRYILVEIEDTPNHTMTPIDIKEVQKEIYEFREVMRTTEVEKIVNVEGDYYYYKEI